MFSPRSLPAVALAAAALSLAACGDTPGENAGSTSSKPEDGALAFAACMREHGVDMPDPKVTSDGKIQLKGLEPGSGLPPKVFEEAQKACQSKLRAGADAMSPADRRQAAEQGLKFARCMRAHGVDFPDPGADGSIMLQKGTGPDPESAAFRRAEQACQDEMPGPKAQP